MEQQFTSGNEPYRASGHFNANGDVQLNINIETEISNNPYIPYPIYNLSRITDPVTEEQINAILIFIKRKRDDGIDFGEISAKYNLNFNISELSEHRSFNSAEFDTSKEDALVILYHDNIFDYEYVNYFFELLENDYKKTNDQNVNYFTTRYVPSLNPPVIPRSVGLTIIKKTQP